MSSTEFHERFENCAVVLKGATKDSRAFRTWNREFFSKFGNELVRIRKGGTEFLWEASAFLEGFIRALDGDEPLYLAEWYVFKDHPELLADVIHTLPEYLLEDWFELLPPGWGAFETHTRNNVYWGRSGTCTGWHFDNWETSTWNTVLWGTKRWLVCSFRELDDSGFGQGAGNAGLLDGRTGFISVEKVERYATQRPQRMPELRFFWADVGPGDLIHVPRRWGHQVHNIGETFAVSRYYIGPANYDACTELVRSRGGNASFHIMNGIMGGPKQRALLKDARVRKLLMSRPVCEVFKLTLRMLGVGPSTHLDPFGK